MDGLLDRIVCGDCISVLSGTAEPFADLVFADPPFNIGFGYDKYEDRVESERYIAWTEDWMRACVPVLRPHGSFYIAIGDEYAHHVRLIGERLGLGLRNWIIWHYTFGQQTKAKFARAHAHIFYFVRDPKNFTFNDYAVRVPSDRQLKYNDKRANAAGKMPDDVWNQYSRVCGTFAEREGWHPCQMPELLLARIIGVSSNPGDVVLDPFNGSGTTTVTAAKMHRRYVGVELSENYAEKARERLETATREQEDGEFGLADPGEILELKRLFVDIGLSTQDYLESPKLLEIFTKQFSLRMNNGKPYRPEQMADGIRELSTWVVRR